MEYLNGVKFFLEGWLWLLNVKLVWKFSWDKSEQVLLWSREMVCTWVIFHMLLARDLLHQPFSPQTLTSSIKLMTCFKILTKPHIDIINDANLSSLTLTFSRVSLILGDYIETSMFQSVFQLKWGNRHIQAYSHLSIMEWWLLITLLPIHIKWFRLD